MPCELVRLAQEMSDKVASDESNLENISIKNRPMVVTSEYENFFSNEWLDLKTVLDSREGAGEEEKIAFLCDLVMVRYFHTLHVLVSV